MPVFFLDSTDRGEDWYDMRTLGMECESLHISGGVDASLRIQSRAGGREGGP